MVANARSAGWGRRPHLAPVRRHLPALLVAIGAVALVAGTAVGIDALSPMFAPRAPAGQLTPVTTTQDTSVLPGVDGQSIGEGTRWLWDGPVNGVAFQMEVPALGYRATVFEGVGKAQLDRGPGHYPKSAWPGGPGNVAIAAHNVYWMSFNRLRPGDQVVIQTRHARFVYKVTGMKVVNPDDSSVLGPSVDHRLTLTTCYPLWAGAYATQRLIFFASEIGPAG